MPKNNGKQLASKESGKQPANTESEKQTRRFWSKNEKDCLIACMRDLVNEDPLWKLDCGQFKVGFYRECEKRLLLAFPGTDLRANPHVESKIKMWRKQYHAVQDALKRTGFGWDDTEKMIMVESDDVWNNFVKSNSDGKGLRNKPLPQYENWLHLFGKDRATGDLAEGPADVATAMDKEDATADEGYDSPVVQLASNTMDFSMSGDGGQPMLGSGGQSAAPSSSNAGGRKRARVGDGISKALSDMVNAFGAFFANTNASMAEIAQRIKYNQDLSRQRRLVNAELMDHPLGWTQRLRAATMIVEDPQKMDLFFSLPKEDQVGWVALLLGGCFEKLNNV